MSKRHETQERRRHAVEGYRQRGPRFAIRESRSEVRHNERRARTAILRWYSVIDQETGEPVGAEYSNWRHAQQVADQLNGRRDRAARERRRDLRNRQPTRPLRQRVEYILDKAGCITGGCPRHKTDPMLTVVTDDDGSVIVRSTRDLRSRQAGATWSPYSADEQEEFSGRLRAKPLTKAGLFVTEERDAHGLYLRVRDL